MRADARVVGAERPAGDLREERGRAAGIHRQPEGRDCLGDAAQYLAADQRRQVRLVGRAHVVRIVAAQVLVRVEEAHHPVHPVGGTRKAELLAEGIEGDQRIVLVGRAEHDVGRAVVEVDAGDRVPGARGRDRGQHRVVHPRRGPVDLGRNALVLDVLLGRAVGVGQALVRVRHRDDALPARGQRVDDRRGRATVGGHVDAAALLAAGVVAGEVDAQVGGRLQQQLHAHGVVVHVVVVGLRARAVGHEHFVIAVALALGGVDAERRVVTQRVVVGPPDADQAVVAHGHLALNLLGVAGAAGDDVDDAGRGVLAEHRSLRPLQHLDALQLAQVAEADAVAGPVDAVDDDAHRRLQAGVVAHRADAADAGGGLRRGLGAGHGQARHQHLHVLDVAHAGIEQQLLGQHVDHDRHVLQGLLALLRGDHHRGERGRLLGALLRGRLRLILGVGQGSMGQGHEAGKHGHGQQIALRLDRMHGCPPNLGNQVDRWNGRARPLLLSARSRWGSRPARHPLPGVP